MASWQQQMQAIMRLSHEDVTRLPNNVRNQVIQLRQQYTQNNQYGYTLNDQYGYTHNDQYGNGNTDSYVNGTNDSYGNETNDADDDINMNADNDADNDADEEQKSTQQDTGDDDERRETAQFNQRKLASKSGKYLLTNVAIKAVSGTTVPMNCLGYVKHVGNNKYAILMAKPFEAEQFDLSTTKIHKIISFNQTTARKEAVELCKKFTNENIGIPFTANTNEKAAISRYKMKKKRDDNVRNLQMFGSVEEFEINEDEFFEWNDELKLLAFKAMADGNFLYTRFIDRLKIGQMILNKLMLIDSNFADCKPSNLLKTFYKDHNDLLKGLKEGKVIETELIGYNKVIWDYIQETGMKNMITSSHADMTTDEISDKREKVRIYQLKRAKQLEEERKEKDKRQKAKEVSTINFFESGAERNKALKQKIELENKDNVSKKIGSLCASVNNLWPVDNMGNAKDIEITPNGLKISKDKCIEILFDMSDDHILYNKFERLSAMLDSSPSSGILEIGIKRTFSGYVL